ncbi:hypothetical protein RB653_004500 [Dictyostelium firmibasis]|uniref:phosphatidylinositol 3-kinase n=1 Tax=Dictyostelium firmibasis TaxID=79012 RepID=A0AAN7U7L4_9MYCE
MNSIESATCDSNEINKNTNKIKKTNLNNTTSNSDNNSKDIGTYNNNNNNSNNNNNNNKNNDNINKLRKDSTNKQNQEINPEMSENKKIYNSNDSNSSSGSGSGGGYVNNGHHILIEENERLEHENQEIQEIYKQKGMEFQKKDLRFGYDNNSSNGGSGSGSGSCSSNNNNNNSSSSSGDENGSNQPVIRTRMREGSILNLKKQGLVKEISQKFQTPDTASYTKPNTNNVSIKDKILILKKEQEKRKQEIEAQQREKVIVLSADSSNIQIYHPSVLIDKMNSKLDTEEKATPKTPTPTTTTNNDKNTTTKPKISPVKIEERPITIPKQQQQQQQQQLTTPITDKKVSTTPTTTVTTPKSNTPSKKTSPDNVPTPTSTGKTNKKDKKDKKDKSRDSGNSTNLVIVNSNSSNNNNNGSNNNNNNDTIIKRRGRVLVTPSSDLKKNIQIYFTIPMNPSPIKINRPNQLLSPIAQQFLKTLISNELPTDCKINEINDTDTKSVLSPSASSSFITKSSQSLLNVQSLRVKAIKTNFDILFLMPNQSKRILQVKGSDTIEILKERIISEYLPNNNNNDSNNNSNSKYGADSYLILDFNDNPMERSLVLNKSDYILDKRAQGLIPKLKVIEKSTIIDSDPSDELSSSEYEIIRKLIAGTDTWRGEEVEYFRRVMSRLRYEALPLIKGSIQSTLLVRLSPLPIPIVGNKILISVFLPITQVTKTMDLESNETADQFTNRLFTKNYSKHLPNVNSNDFILKVVGSSDFIHGPYDFRTFESIRNHIIQGTKPQLTLIQRPKPELDPQPFKPRFDYPPELPIDHSCSNATINTNNSSGSNSINSNGNFDSWDQITHVSIREIKRPFKVKVMGSTRIPLSSIKDIDSSSVIVSISLYHGIDCFSKAFTQPIIPPPFAFLAESLSVDWCEWLVFTNIDYSNLPVDARLSISVYSANDTVDDVEEIKNHDETTKNLTPIGWINVMISDFRYQLRQGLVELSLWPSDFSNPLGTCSNNPSISQSVGLTLEFEEFNLPVLFPRKSKSSTVIEQPPTNINSNEMREFFEQITSLDPLSDLKQEKYNQLWTLRHYSILFPQVLPRLMLSVPWTQATAVDEAISLLDRWPKLKPYEALELLDAKHANRKVREFAVTCLEDLSEDELVDILLQLVQVLKYEPFHDSKLSRFLLRKAILNRNIGHSFFWYLKSDLHVSNLSERFGILLESYLFSCGAHRVELLKQMDVINNLTEVAKKIKPLKDQDRREFMIKEFESLEWPKRFHLTLNPRFESNGLIINKCRYMDSKKLPLRLSFTNTDMSAEPIEVIFKAGDDLRQDMLTLQMIRLMDKLWQKEGLDLKLSPYGCISTGDMIGMIEVVLNSETTAKIQKSGGGGATAAFKLDPLANWLSQHNKTETEYQKAVDTFIMSCAGYCVATYILGIGDRHNDNLMCTRSGRLFHIDFGHFLGNYKKKFGIKRERAPFVFTPDMCYLMGGKESFKFSQFVNYCCTAYNIVRKNAKLFMNLFAMMVSTGIPELQSMNDLNYLKESFSLELSDEKAREKFVGLIHESLSTKTTQINNMIHIMAH